MPQALARIPKTDPRPPVAPGDALPALYRPDPKTARRVLEFFTANIRNKNTRAAYGRAVSDFAAWCDTRGIESLDLIEPVHVAAYVEDLQGRIAPPSVKLRLAARCACSLTGSSSARSFR